MNNLELPKRQESREQIIDNYIALFLKYRYKWVDYLPQQRMEVGDPNYSNSKCRTAWFSAVYGDSSLLLDEIPDISDSIKSEYNKLDEFIHSLDYGKFRIKRILIGLIYT